MASEDKRDKRPASWVIFGAQQQCVREHGKMRRQELADGAGYSVDLVRKIERVERKARPEYVQKVDDTLQARGMLIATAEELAKRVQWPEWFAEYVEAESTALRIEKYDTLVVPGLLQSEDYARAVLSAHYPTLDDEEVEARVAARLERQVLLTRRPTCMLSFVVEEWVLHRPIGGSQVMKDQLHKLAECGRRRNVTVQVLPTTCESHAGFDGPMTLVETADGMRAAYVEGQAGGNWVTVPEDVRVQEGRYGIIRGQALSAEGSLTLIEQLAGEL